MLYFMEESVDPDFIKSRFKDDSGEGNLYKMCRHVYLNYYVSDPGYYQNDYGSYPDGSPQ